MKQANNILKNISQKDIINRFKKFSKKNIIILSILLISILWINYTLSNALNSNGLELDSKITNHFMNKFIIVRKRKFFLRFILFRALYQSFVSTLDYSFIHQLIG